MTQTAAQIIKEHYESNLRDAVDRGPAPVREQIMVAMDAIPQDVEGLDDWFKEYIQKPPVSRDTDLYNQLHKAKEELKELLADAS